MPVGEMHVDRRGRPRTDGYRMTIEPSEADVVLRIFREFADGTAIKRLVKELNAEEVRGRGTAGRELHRLVAERLSKLRLLLEGEATKSALTLRRVLGQVRLVRVVPDDAPVLPSRNRPPSPRSSRGPGGRFELIRLVEAVGIEPTSEDPRPQASTSMSGLLYDSLALRPSIRQEDHGASLIYLARPLRQGFGPATRI